MIKIEEVQVAGFEAALRGMRNPKNSWDRSDSVNFGNDICTRSCQSSCPVWEMCHKFTREYRDPDFEMLDGRLVMGPNDYRLANQLSEGGPVHAKYRRMIVVWCDITAPLYWWKEFDTYKVGTVANSCSTMHKIHAKEFTKDDFSMEKLTDILAKPDLRTDLTLGTEQHWFSPLFVEELTIDMLNATRRLYLEEPSKDTWYQMIQMLPSSYNQRRTVMMNYEVLANILTWRQTHKLDEWREFCKWARTLPYADLFLPKEVRT